MSTENDGGWGTETGLKDHFQIVVEKSRFGYNEKYQNGETLMIQWSGTDPEDGEEISLELPCGSGFEKKDERGKTAEYPGKPRKRFHEKSFYGQLIDVAITKEGEEAPNGHEGFGMMKLLQERGNPMDATVWEGLHFECKKTRFTFGTKIEENEDGEEIEVKITSDRVFPVKFLGVADDAGRPGKTSKTSKTSKTKAKKADPEPDEGPDEKPEEGSAASTNGKPSKHFSKKVLAKAKALLKKSKGDFDTWMDGMLALAEVEADDSLIEFVVDEKDGLFAELNG